MLLFISSIRFQAGCAAISTAQMARAGADWPKVGERAAWKGFAQVFWLSLTSPFKLPFRVMQVLNILIPASRLVNESFHTHVGPLEGTPTQPMPDSFWGGAVEVGPHGSAQSQATQKRREGLFGKNGCRLHS